MNKHKSNKIKENSNTVRHLMMGQIITTQNLVAIKEVRHAGQIRNINDYLDCLTVPIVLWSPSLHALIHLERFMVRLFHSLNPQHVYLSRQARIFRRLTSLLLYETYERCGLVRRSMCCLLCRYRSSCHTADKYPDSKVHGTYMGPTWGRQDPGGLHVGPMNLAIRVYADWHFNGQYVSPAHVIAQ